MGLLDPPNSLLLVCYQALSQWWSPWLQVTRRLYSRCYWTAWIVIPCYIQPEYVYNQLKIAVHGTYPSSICSNGSMTVVSCVHCKVLRNRKPEEERDAQHIDVSHGIIVRKLDECDPGSSWHQDGDSKLNKQHDIEYTKLAVTHRRCPIKCSIWRQILAME